MGNKNHSRWLAATLVFAGALLAAACGGEAGEQGDGSSDELPVVRIQALSGGMGGVGLKALEVSGSDEANGFEGEFLFLDPDAAGQFFLQRRSDVAFDGDPVGTAIARNEGFEITIFGSYNPNNSCLLVKEGSPYKTPEDLVGERVGHTGIETGTTQNISVLLDAFHGVNFFDDYQLVESDPSGVVELLKNDEVEGITTFEPHISRAIVEADARCLFGPATQEWEEREGGEILLAGIGAYDDWIEENPELAEAVLAAWEDTVEWIEEDPDRLKQEVFTDFIGIDDPEVLDLIIERVVEVPIYTTDWSEETRSSADRLVDLLAEQGDLLQEKPDGVLTVLGE
jgi:NitT/TauT family transport system substrate-binding protein